MNKLLALPIQFKFTRAGKRNTLDRSKVGPEHMSSRTQNGPISKGKAMETRNGETSMKQIALLLIQADKLVKEGNFQAALQKIAEARMKDPGHLYAIAYEERITSLMPAELRERQDHVPSAQRTAEQQGTQEMTGAAEQAASAHAKPITTELAIARLIESARRSFEKKEYLQALDEIARIYLLGPMHATARALEQQIRLAMQQQTGNAAGQGQSADIPGVQSGRSQDPAMTAAVRSTVEKQNSVRNEPKTDPSSPMTVTPSVKQTAVTVQSPPVPPNPAGNGSTARNGLPNAQGAQQSVKEQRNTVQFSVPNIDSVECIRRVDKLLRGNNLEQALSELTRVVITDPFNEKVILLEKTIIDAQHRQLEERKRCCREIISQIG